MKINLPKQKQMNFMKSNEEIIEIIKDKLDDIEYSNSQPRMSDEFYLKNDAKIEILEEIIRLITE